MDNESTSPVQRSRQQLRRFTNARVALERAGNSLTTRAALEFELAEAEARDAVRVDLDPARLTATLDSAGFSACQVHSAASCRDEYLMRPDLGRKMNEESRLLISGMKRAVSPDILFVVADGLSAAAVERHAVPVLEHFRAGASHISIGPVVVAAQARVAIGDDVGELLGARSVAVLIGERPGSSSPDSMGIYYTWAPRVGRTDAERNCISNVRPAALSYALAASELLALMKRAQRAGRTGTQLAGMIGPWLD